MVEQVNFTNGIRRRDRRGALHQVAMVRIKTGGPWTDEYRRRRESHPHPAVMRLLKRKLA